MRTIRNIAFCLLAALILVSCSKKEDYIPRHDFAVLLADLYMEDGYIESRPELRAQTDSLFIYKPIIESHGYTIDRYYATLNHYISDFDEWTALFNDVKSVLTDRKKIVDPAADAYMMARGLGSGSIFGRRLAKGLSDTASFKPHHFYQDGTDGLGAGPVSIPPIPTKVSHDLKQEIDAALKGVKPVSATSNTVILDSENETDTLEIPDYLRRKSD
jgi:hypothetical protein